VLGENVRIYQQPFSRLPKSKEMNPIYFQSFTDFNVSKKYSELNYLIPIWKKFTNFIE